MLLFIRQNSHRLTATFFQLLILFIFTITASEASNRNSWDAMDFMADTIDIPVVSLEASPIEEIVVNKTSVAAFRKPPGKGPFPTVFLLHGGGDFGGLERMKERARGEVIMPLLLLAKGYAVVHATRKAELTGPGPVVDTVEMAKAVKARPDVADIVAFAGSAGGPPGLELASTGIVQALALGEPATFFYLGPTHEGMLTETFIESVKDSSRPSFRELLRLTSEEGWVKYYDPVREGARAKMATIRCPVFLAHGNLQEITELNFGVFFPEMALVGNDIEAKVYPGSTHGFYWGKSPRTPETLFEFVDDLDNFFRKHIDLQPREVEPTHIEVKTIDIQYTHPEAKRRRKANQEKAAAADPLKGLEAPTLEQLPRESIQGQDVWGDRVTYTPSDKVTVIPDIVYAQYAGRELKLDLFLPKSRSAEPVPGIIAIRGGGWLRGEKEGYAPLASLLAEQGLAAVSIEYRTINETPFPTQIHDVKAAVRWLRANAAEYGIDGDKLGAIGGSAGAHLALLLSTSHGIPELEGHGGNADVSSRIQAIVCMAGSGEVKGIRNVKTGVRAEIALKAFANVDNPEEMEILMSPVTHLDPSDPPLLIMHSNTDGAVPLNSGKQLAASYREAGVHVEMRVIDRAPHAFWWVEKWQKPIMTKAGNFFYETLGHSSIKP